MNHQEIEEKEIIARYVLHQLAPDERLAFQEHYFSCDECFDHVQMEARFTAGVRSAARAGVLAAHQPGRLPSSGRFGLKQQWAWVMPAVAASLLLAFAVTGLWALSLRRENRLLAERTADGGSASERLRRLEDRIRELEARNNGLQEQSEEIKRLKEELAASERRSGSDLARMAELDINVPVRNVYPLNDAQRSSGTPEVNRVRVPRGTRAFVLILGDYKPGFSDYRLEIRDPDGRRLASRAGLKPDQAGDLSVMLNRTLLSQSKYRLKLYGGKEQLAEYVIQVE